MFKVGLFYLSTPSAIAKNTLQNHFRWLLIILKIFKGVLFLYPNTEIFKLEYHRIGFRCHTLKCSCRNDTLAWCVSVFCYNWTSLSSAINLMEYIIHRCYSTLISPIWHNVLFVDSMFITIFQDYISKSNMTIMECTIRIQILTLWYRFNGIILFYQFYLKCLLIVELLWITTLFVLCVLPRLSKRW